MYVKVFEIRVLQQTHATENNTTPH